MTSPSALFAIPPQPRNVLEINALLDKPGANTARIADLIGKDPSLTAQVLKTANSPGFSRGRATDSVFQALQVMGLRNFKAIILKCALRQVFSQTKNAFLEEFWRHSELIAQCCAVVARSRAPEFAHGAYLAGLFHDCAIPLMTQRFGDYKDFIGGGFRNEDNFIQEEERRYSINHCALSYLFAKAWSLPAPICLAIHHHHDESLPNPPDSASARTMTAIVMTSHYVINRFDVSGRGDETPVNPEEWTKSRGDIAALLGLLPDDLYDFEEELFIEAA
jgi:HD-like signal output (HDOD) protein